MSAPITDLTTWQQIQNTIFSSSTSSLSRIIEFWPNILGAIGVILVGWVVSVMVYKIIIKSSMKLHLGVVADKLKLHHLLKKAGIKTPLAELLGRFLKGYIFTMFFIGAANIIHLYQIASFLESIIDYIPRVFIALIIVLFGLQIGDTLANIVQGALSFSERHTARIMAIVAKYSLIFFSILAALVKLDIANSLVEILFIGFVSMLALGGGLAMGLGGKDIARELLEAATKKQKNKKSVN